MATAKTQAFPFNANFSDIAETQIIAAGSQFNGLAPTTPVRRLNGHRTFHPDAQGGLFVPVANPQAFIKLTSIMLALDGNTTTWTVSMVPNPANAGQGPNVLLLSGTNETGVVRSFQEAVTLPPDWHLAVVTTGATGQIAATLVWEKWRDAVGASGI